MVPSRAGKAFETTRFSGWRFGGENVPAGATGGGKEAGIQPSPFSNFSQWLADGTPGGCAPDKRITGGDDAGPKQTNLLTVSRKITFVDGNDTTDVGSLNATFSRRALDQAVTRQFLEEVVSLLLLLGR